MSDVLDRYRELTDKHGHALPHRDAAILTLAEVIDNWLERVTFPIGTDASAINTYDNSRE